MKEPMTDNELLAADAFSTQAPLFDALYTPDRIIQYKRDRVRQHLLRYFAAGDQLLELNCGTGEDALYFAEMGFDVHATDISTRMLDMLGQKAVSKNIAITTEACSFLQLATLKSRGPFDHIYSNFGGLNCTGDLDKVLRSLDVLLKPGGRFTFVIISRFCLWEFLLLFRGRFKTAFRRFFSAKGRQAHVEGKYFKCWYYKPSYIQQQLKEKFALLELEGLCTIVPPSYIEKFGESYPRMFEFLKRKENKYRHSWLWRGVGDYFVITMKKT